MLKIDLTGQRFGRLLVLRRSAKRSSVGTLWDCACDCGGSSISDSLKLRTGHTTSCGCHKLSVLGLSLVTHGQANKTPTYRTWKEMRQRCMNPKSDKWQWYGGRGIAVCERWDRFANFLADMGERPEGMTLDRKDNDGPYSPENCQWATQLEQTRKQAKNKLSVEIADQIRSDKAAGITYAESARRHGVSKTTAHRAAMGVTWKRP